MGDVDILRKANLASYNTDAGVGVMPLPDLEDAYDSNFDQDDPSNLQDNPDYGFLPMPDPDNFMEGDEGFLPNQVDFPQNDVGRFNNHPDQLEEGNFPMGVLPQPDHMDFQKNGAEGFRPRLALPDAGFGPPDDPRGQGFIAPLNLGNFREDQGRRVFQQPRLNDRAEKANAGILARPPMNNFQEFNPQFNNNPQQPRAGLDVHDADFGILPHPEEEVSENLSLLLQCTVCYIHLCTVI